MGNKLLILATFPFFFFYLFPSSFSTVLSRSLVGAQSSDWHILSSLQGGVEFTIYTLQGGMEFMIFTLHGVLEYVIFTLQGGKEFIIYTLQGV